MGQYFLRTHSGEKFKYVFQLCKVTPGTALQTHMGSSGYPLPSQFVSNISSDTKSWKKDWKKGHSIASPVVELTKIRLMQILTWGCRWQGAAHSNVVISKLIFKGRPPPPKQLCSFTHYENGPLAQMALVALVTVNFCQHLSTFVSFVCFASFKVHQ